PDRHVQHLLPDRVGPGNGMSRSILRRNVRQQLSKRRAVPHRTVHGSFQGVRQPLSPIHTVPSTLRSSMDSVAIASVYFGTSSAGLRVKNPLGMSLNPARWTVITGHSSGRGMCVTPIVYHSTTSSFSTERLARTHLGRPSPPLLWWT